MQFQLAPLDFSQFATQFAGVDSESSFANVTSREFNRIKHEDGRLIVIANGQEIMKAQSLHVVVAAFQHDDFVKARRQWYEGTWTPTQEAGKHPDCSSFDGVVPDAGAAKPQSATCATCPNSTRGADGYVACGRRKSFVLFLCKLDASTGQAVVDTATPYVFDASAKSLYSEYEQITQSGGTHRIIPLLRKSGAVIEAVVLELGFHQGSKAPTIKPVGAVPPDVARAVIAAAKEEAVKALLAPIGPKAPALPAPVNPAQLAAPAPVAPPVPVAPPAPAAQPAAPWVPTEQAFPAAPAPVAQAAPAPAAPVAQAAPAGNRMKALGAFSSLVGTK